MLKICVRQLDIEGSDFEGTVSSKALELQVNDSPANIAFGPEVEYRLHASSVSGGVLVTGFLSVSMDADCVRCLKRYTTLLEVPDVCHFYEEISTDELDVSDDLREDLLIALPSKYLCSGDCSGLCPFCGVNLNDNTCKCTQPDVETNNEDDENPWSALDKLDI